MGGARSLRDGGPGCHLAIAVTLVLFGVLTVLPVRTPTFDTQFYVSMAQGKYSGVMTSERYRVVVPTLAGLLPVSPLLALRLITCVSMAAVYLLALTECSSIGIVGWPALSALTVIFCSRVNLYNFYNPYLTDGMGLAVLFFLSWCFLADFCWPFVAAGILGIFVRESALFVAPAWLFSPKWRKGIWIFSLCLLAFILPRLLFPSSTTYDEYVRGHIQDTMGKATELARAVKGALLSWHCVWLVGLCGLLRLPRRVQVLAGLLLLGAAASVIVAADERMLSILAPVMFLGVGKALRGAWSADRAVVTLFLCTLPLQFLFCDPYVLQGLPVRIHHLALVASVALSAVCAAGVAWMAMEAGEPAGPRPAKEDR